MKQIGRRAGEHQGGKGWGVSLGIDNVHGSVPSILGATEMGRMLSLPLRD